MESNNYFTDVVMKRKTSRDFKEIPVNIENLVLVERFYNSIEKLNGDIETELVFLGEKGKALEGVVGYNGFHIKAPNYLILLSEAKDHYLENAGYIGQALTLKFTELGLVLCWQTINDSEKLKKVFDIQSNKEAVAFIAVGYPNKDDRTIRLDIKSPSDVDIHRTELKPAHKVGLDEMVFHNVYGNPLRREDLYEELENGLIAICHAQSFYDLQPYRVILGESEIYLIGLKENDTPKEDKFLNYGIAMYNFASVIGASRNEFPKWSFDKPDVNLNLPENAFYVAKCGF